MATSPDEAAPGPAPAPADETPAAPVAGNDAAPAGDSQTPDLTLAGEAMNLLSEHKGKLAIGVAATLGMMVYYGWRENRLAKTDPEEYARLQRLKASVRHSDDQPRPKGARKSAPKPQADAPDAPADGQRQADAAPGHQLPDSSTPE